jgi:membrane protein implicated in regulation of membrane protease activity
MTEADILFAEVGRSVFALFAIVGVVFVVYTLAAVWAIREWVFKLEARVKKLEDTKS